VPLTGVLGWPVAHSRSPAMHEAAFAELGLAAWRYQRLPVPPALFAETARALGAAGFAGANVTIPHKEAALALADEAGEEAAAIGAANTLTYTDGRIRADNTDAPGLLAALGEPVEGRTALVLGAGGSARAAVWALLRAGVRDVMVWNRTPARAEALCTDLGGRPVLESEPADLLLNCTSVGLDASDQTFKELPIAADGLGDYCALIDLVYTESATALARAAVSNGVKTVDGLEVLVHQGALSLERWTGRTAPIETMRRAARRRSPQ
jgi:shikimate dehydrogenase